MSKRFLFLIYSILMLSQTYASYGAPGSIKLDFDDSANVVTEPGFTSFLTSDSGKTISGITIDLSGDIDDCRRLNPNSGPPSFIPIWTEEVYRDFIFGISPSGVSITLWGLGAYQDCNITIYAFDDGSLTPRLADWTFYGLNLFTTEFEGGDIIRWPSPWNYSEDPYEHTGTAVADWLGRIIIESTRHWQSPEGQNFAFVNGLVVTPISTYVPPALSQRPVPFDGAEGVPIDAVLSWKVCSYAEAHDVYLGTNFNDVRNASRGDPMGVLVSQNQVANAFDPYGASGFLKLDTTYYWRVDEVNSVPAPQTITKGEVWSFTTLPYLAVDGFDSYDSSDSLKGVWKDYFTQSPPLTSAQVYVEAVTVRDGNSMRYRYRNNLAPYYSECRATTVDLGIDPNWFGVEAKSISVWLYGQPNNDANERMYIQLTDGSNPGQTAKVLFQGYIPGEWHPVKVQEWYEWNIDLQYFVADNPSFDLHDVAKITIGFGDGTDPGDDPNGTGTVYFDDFRIYPTRCILSERLDDFALVDYAPGGDPAGDCKVDYQEFEIMANTWLARDDAVDTINPGAVNLIAYWPMDQGAGIAVPTLPPNPLYNGTFSGSGVSWVTPGVPNIGGAAAICVDGSDGSMVSIGNEDPTGGANAITLAIWAKWAGPTGVSQGLIGKRDNWSANGLMFMFECDTRPGHFGSIALRQYSPPNTDVYSPNHILDGFIGQWAHLAATFDGTTARLYLNGDEVASGPFSFGNGTGASMAIGNTNGAGGSLSYEAFNGDLDEARIYNRALEPNEIAFLADTTPAGNQLYIPVPSAADIHKEEPAGERVIDFKDFVLLANKWLIEDLFP